MTEAETGALSINACLERELTFLSTALYVARRYYGVVVKRNVRFCTFQEVRTRGRGCVLGSVWLKTFGSGTKGNCVAQSKKTF